VKGVDTLIISALIAVLAGLIIGAICGHLIQNAFYRKRNLTAENEAANLVEEANNYSLDERNKSEESKRAIILEGREEVLKLKANAELEIDERRSELQATRRRIVKREKDQDRRSRNLDNRDEKVVENEKGVDQLRSDLEGFRDQEIERLEELTNTPISQVEEILTHRAEENIEHELAIRYRDMEEEAKVKSQDDARFILTQAIQRLASEVVSEATVVSVQIPNDEMKGRLIGKEGRNIRAIERATGADLIIDDSPEVVTLSCFDPIRRQVARLSVEKLIADGRIHPARIESIVERSEKEITETVWKAGEQAMLDTGVRGLHPEIIKLLGRLKYRTSYGENVLMHSMEVCNLAGLMAAEVGANVRISKIGGLLHDIGKAVSHEVEGPHATIGAEIADRYNVSKQISRCIGEHHDDEMTSVEAFLVSAADAISAARPGSRSDTVENYMERLKALEDVANSFDGVQKTFAIQAGREVRVMVSPESINDVDASKLARGIVKKIEDNLAYPGQIKVTVIRESRSVEYAR
jgi:ribonuclease Y